MNTLTLQGNLLKMQSEMGDPVRYTLPLGAHRLPLNPLIGGPIRLQFNGQINDIHDGQRIKKSYGQGYSYKNFITLACCDSCIVKPQLCHFDQGTCREPEWGETHCFRPHCLYLAYTSGPKVGITRETQIPTRWVDQGAVCALPILRVADRKTSGLIEVELSRDIEDKTNWRKMLQQGNEMGEVDLYQERENIFATWGDLLDDLGAEDLEAEMQVITYPVESLPPKIKSLGFDKTPLIEGTLTGIKGQYLILDQGVLNIRKHQGYHIELTVPEV